MAVLVSAGKAVLPMQMVLVPRVAQQAKLPLPVATLRRSATVAVPVSVVEQAGQVEQAV